MLQKGLLSPANQRQDQVITDLKDMLEILRSGLADPDKRRQKIAAWKNILEQISRLRDRDAQHQRDSAVSAEGKPMADNLAALGQQLKDLVRKQEDLLQQTEQLSPPGSAVDTLAGLSRSCWRCAGSRTPFRSRPAPRPSGGCRRCRRPRRTSPTRPRT